MTKIFNVLNAENGYQMMQIIVVVVVIRLQNKLAFGIR